MITRLCVGFANDQVASFQLLFEAEARVVAEKYLKKASLAIIK